MFSPSRLLLAIVLSIGLANAQGSLDTSHGTGNLNNVKVANLVEDAMINMPNGKYTFRNVATGEYLVYDYSNGQSLSPQAVDESKAAVLTLTDMERQGSRVHTSDDYGRIKCMSQQWWYEGDKTNFGDDSIVGGNWLAALYDCALGPNAISGSTVEKAKQVWAFIPVRAHAEVEVSKGVEEASGAQLKVAAVVMKDLGLKKEQAVEEKAYVEPESKSEPKPEPKAPAPEPKKERVAAVKKPEATPEPAAEPAVPARKCLRRRSTDLRKRSLNAYDKYLAAVAKRDAKKLAKRQITYVPNAYYVIGRDHLYDMQTRALAGGKDQQTDTSIWSSRMEVFDKSTNQQWIVTKVE